MARKILIVDDDKSVRRIYKKLLTVRTFEVSETENGEQAILEILKGRDFDLVLLDVRMPVVNGAAFFDAIRLYNPEAKVIVTSVYPLEDQRRLIEDADGYFNKSAGARILMEKIEGVLQNDKRLM